MSFEKNDILAAADKLIAAFGRHDRDAYFSAFSPDATFIFHNLDRRLENRLEYEAEWASWEKSGFKVMSCRSSDRQVQLVGSTAIFTHTVETTLTMAGEVSTNKERETIVFARSSVDGWTVVHEHLSCLTSM